MLLVGAFIDKFITMNNDNPLAFCVLNLGSFSFTITPSMLWLSLSSFLLLLFLGISVIRAKVRPGRMQNLLELAFEFIDSQIIRNAGLTKSWSPFIIILFLFILFNNWIGLIPGSDTPSKNINFTGALAILVFLIAAVARYRKHGPGKYLQSILPVGLKGPILLVLFPIELVGQLIKPFSLALRLFANITAGHMIIGTLFGLILIFHNPIASGLSVAGTVAMTIFDMFIGLIQAYIFSFLSAMLIGEALSAE